MAVTTLPKPMERLILKLKQDNPGLSFVEGRLLCWSPEQKQVFYDPNAGVQGTCGVLHEIGHARLKHYSYVSDIDLLRKEAQAWQEALQLAEQYKVPLNSSYVQDCLDTYRDWLYKRSTCPTCQAKGIQRTQTRYRCINCQSEWRVSNSRFCRPYRRQKNTRM
jgi:hypothetical protein